MKVKFLKDKFSYKADAIVEIEATDATDLIAKGFAVEVKEDAETIANSISVKFNEAVDAKVEAASDDIANKAMEKFSAKMKSVKRSDISVGVNNASLDPKGGYKNFTHFLKSVQSNDRSVVNKTGMSEGVSADGGYVVPTDYANKVFAIIMSEDSLVPMTWNIPSATEHLKLPIDNLVTIGTNAVSGSWITPDNTSFGTPTGSGAFNQLSFDLTKFGVLASATTELLNDNNVALEEFLVAKAGYAINYGVNQAIVQGTGTNQPKGIVGSAATITVTASGSDEYVSGLGIQFADIRAMKCRFLKSQYKPTPIWLTNPSCWQDLYDLKDDAGRNLFIASGNLAQTPYSTLLGIPVVETWHCSARGTPGDLILADMGAYVTVTNGGVNAATSLHAYFSQDAMAWRFTYRIDGKPGLSAPLTAPDGSGNKFSPFVILSART